MSAPNQADYGDSDEETRSTYTNATSFQSTLYTVVRQPASTLTATYLIEHAPLDEAGGSQTPTVPPEGARANNVGAAMVDTNQGSSGDRHPAVSANFVANNTEAVLAMHPAPEGTVETRTPGSSPPAHADVSLSISQSSSSSSQAQAPSSDRELVLTARGHARGPGSTGSLPLPPAAARDVPKSGKAASTGSINPAKVDIPSINVLMKQHLKDQASATAATGKSLATVVKNTTGVREGLQSFDSHMSSNLDQMSDSVSGSLKEGFSGLESVIERSMEVIASILRPRRAGESIRQVASSSRQATAIPRDAAQSHHQESLQGGEPRAPARTPEVSARGGVSATRDEQQVDSNIKGKGKQHDENPPDASG